MYLKYPNGFYVNNKLEDESYKFNFIEELIRYVTRYCSRPVIAETRIINYDGNNVTRFYSDHNHKRCHEITESAFSFILKLLRHLLPANFKSIRYYVFYMDSFTRKHKRNNQNSNIFMAIKFKCPICNFERLVPQSESKKMNNETFKNNNFF